MKKIFNLLAILALGPLAFSQVGVNTQTPEASLDVRAKNHTGTTPGDVTAKDGVLVPRVSSLLTNGTVNGQLVYLVADNGSFAKGFHYWDGAAWVPIGAGGNGDGDAWGVTGEDQVSNIGRTGSVAIGANAPDPYAKLDVSSSNQGILVPRINLTSNTLDLNSDGDGNVANQPAGLLIYNSGNTFVKGYYFWNGTEWRSINNSVVTAPVIAGLDCQSAILDPNMYQTGIAYNGYLKIPYTGGNGASYVEGSTITVNGLQFKLQPGTLAYGSGEFVFSVTGTPTVSSPIETSIPVQGSAGNNLIPFLSPAMNCTATVGNSTSTAADVKVAAVMDYMKFVTDPDTGVKGFVVEAKTPDGLYTVRVFMRHSVQNGTATATNNTNKTTSLTENNVQLRNNSAIAKTIMWNFTTFWGTQAGNTSQVPYGDTGAVSVPAGKPGGAKGNSWTTMASGTAAANAGAWGDPGIYNSLVGGSSTTSPGPEYRYYAWIDTSTTSKVAYIATVMAGMDPSALPTATDVTKQKVFIRIEQITGGL